MQKCSPSKADPLKPAIERLRESKKIIDKELHDIGVSAGVEWATEAALAIELERLERVYGSTRRSEPVIEEPAYESIYLLIRGIGPLQEHEECAEEFWDMAFENVPDENPEDLRNHKACLMGFVCGALAVWQQVKGRL